MTSTADDPVQRAGNRRGPPAGGSWRRPGACRLVAVLMLMTVAAGGAGAQTAGGGADTPPGESFDGILRSLELKARPATAPDFVRRSRPAKTDFIPVGRSHPDRPVKVMTPAEVEAETNALDGARQAQQRRAGIKPPPVPLKPAKPVPGAAKTRDR